MGILKRLFGSKTSALVLPNKYWNAPYNFGFSYPVTWQIRSENQTDGSPWTYPVQITGPRMPPGNLLPGVSIQVALMGTGAGVKSYIDNAVRSLRQQFSGFALAEKQTREYSLLGWPAGRIEYSYSRDGRSIAELNVTAIIGKGPTASMFQFVFEVESPHARKLWPLFDKMIASWHIGPGGLRHPYTVVTSVGECVRCHRTVGAAEKINTVRNVDNGSLDTVCDRCWSQRTTA